MIVFTNPKTKDLVSKVMGNVPSKITATKSASLAIGRCLVHTKDGGKTFVCDLPPDHFCCDPESLGTLAYLSHLENTRVLRSVWLSIASYNPALCEMSEQGSAVFDFEGSPV